MKKAIKLKVQWLKEHRFDMMAFIVWTYLFVRFEGVRDFFLNFFKFILGFWAFAIILVIAMVVFALIAFVFMMIGIKIGVIPKDYIAVRISKKHKEE